MINIRGGGGVICNLNAAVVMAVVVVAVVVAAVLGACGHVMW